MADLLSDAELRKNLVELGERVGPITATTRSLYRRKLGKLLLENPVTKTSTPPTNRRTNTLRSRRSLPTSVQATTSNRSPTRRSTKFSDEEENVDEDINSRIRKSLRSSGRHKPSLSATGSTTSKRISRKSFPYDTNNTPNRDNKNQTSIDKVFRSTRSKRTPQSYSDDSDDEQSVAEPPLEAMTRKLFEPSYSSTPNVHDETDTVKTTNLNFSADEKENMERSNYATGTRRVLTSQENKPFQENVTPLHGNTLVNGHRAYNRKKLMKNNEITSRTNNQSSTNSDYLTQATDDEDVIPTSVSRPWWDNLSTFLPIGTVLFFVILGLLYATMKYDANPMEPKMLLDHRKQTVDSFNQTEATLSLASDIYEYVGWHAGNILCTNGNSEGATQLVKINKLLKDLDIWGGARNKTYQYAVTKLIENPEWGVVFYDRDMSKLKTDTSYLEVEYIESKYPLMSGWCRFKRAFMKVLFRILVITTVAMMVWVAVVYHKYNKKRKEEEKQQMYIMVQRILDVLQKHHEKHLQEETNEPFIPILHVRDMLIPPQDRKVMMNIWTKATRFLSANESRVRVENQRISGEDFLVWRWIQVGSLAKKLGSTAREWQGEAFDPNKSINTLVNSPTPCLKVRSMFNVDCEKGENWVTQIQDSILEKCKGNNEILHIFVEKTSKEGLVYIKCMSNAAAGKVFKALHGAWFDARLVTVKFIRLSRFHQRFPATINAPQVPMKPSSPVPVSKFKPSPPDAYEKIYPSLS